MKLENMSNDKLIKLQEELMRDIASVLPIKDKQKNYKKLIKALDIERILTENEHLYNSI